MNNEDTKKWCEYYEKGIKPTKIKIHTIVYSNRAINKELVFHLDGYTVTLKPFEKNKSGVDRSKDYLRDYGPAFFCEVIVGSQGYKQGEMVFVRNALDKIMVWLEIDYDLSTSYKYWEEYEGEWISCPVHYLSANWLLISPDIDKPNIQDILNGCELILKSSNAKKVKKFKGIMINLQEGIRLKKISYKLSFLSFYSVIENISDDLCSKGIVQTESLIAKELSDFKLIGSQRSKVYYLMKALDNKFDLQKCIDIADLRNTLTHNPGNIIKQEDLEYCQKIAFWAGEKFVGIHTASEKKIVNHEI